MPTTKSVYPDIDIPNVGLWDFLFERPMRDFNDKKIIYLDPDTGRNYTYATVKSTAADFGHGLRARWNWGKGDVLAIYSPNSIDFPVIAWGVHFAGGIVSPSNPAYTADELAFQLKDSGAKALATQLPQLALAVQACRKVGLPEDRICLIGDGHDRAGRFTHFTNLRPSPGAQRHPRAPLDPDRDLAFIPYSSGTMGKPKGVKLSHRNIIANTLQVTACEPHICNRKRPGRIQGDPGSPEGGDAILAFLPFFHIYGLTVLLHQSMYRGLKCIVMAAFNLQRFCQLIQDHRISVTYVAPPVVLQLAKAPGVERSQFRTLRMINSGAAPLTRELVEAMYKRIGVPVKQGYGLTETSPTTHMQAWEDWNRTIGSVGPLLPNQVAKYMSPEENEVSIGQVGELWIKGPNVFKGYLNNDEGTKNALTSDGFFKTGDVGFQDESGNFYITDRVKELIKYKGFQVPPASLEGVLASHSKIDDVAVLGLYREDQATEVPIAFLVPKQGVQPSPELEKEIVDWLAERVANHMRLRGGVRWIDAIPKSASGKILRRMLKGKLAEEQKQDQKQKQARAKL